MRRLFVTLCLAILCQALFPARADAYLWKWLDDLSGPQFYGWDLEWRVWCKSEDVRQNRASLIDLRNAILKERNNYDQLSSIAAEPRRTYLQVALLAATYAAEDVQTAIDALDTNSTGRAEAFVRRALEWRRTASTLLEFLESVGQSTTPAIVTPDEIMALRKSQPPVVEDDAKQNMSGKDRFLIPGVIVSVCDAKTYQRRTAFASVDFGFGYDQKPENRNDHNRIFTVGGSYQAVVTPYLSVGAGVGVAFFSSQTTKSFETLYVRPYIIDFRPFALRRNVQFSGPWWQVLIVRYSTLTFPKGFEAGRFGGRSPRFEAELIHSIGLHADLEPVMRKLRDKW